MELFNSVGIEIETENIRAESLRNLGNYDFRLTRDASCESDGYTLNGMKVNLEESNKKLLKYFPMNRNTYGCELVTAGTLDTSNLDYLYQLKKITNLLVSKGENPKSYRAGFHVHINLSYNLSILKSVLRLARHLEQVLYLLGGMGYDYRGFKNDSAYCRPITKFGPVCVKTGWKTYSQVFTISELLKTKDTQEFKHKYGNIDKLRGSHYIPIRYHGINLLPLFTQGSLEFRMFNKSTNPYYLMAIIEFCKSFSKYVIESSFKSLKEENLLKENSIFDVRGEVDRDYIMDTFGHFLEVSSLENREIIDTLYEILGNSSVDSLVTPNEYVFTHLMFHRQGERSPTHWTGTNYEPKVIPKNEIKIPKFEDIHVLRENGPQFDTNRRRELVDNLETYQAIRGNRPRNEDGNRPARTLRYRTGGGITTTNWTALTTNPNPNDAASYIADINGEQVRIRITRRQAEDYAANRNMGESPHDFFQRRRNQQEEELNEFMENQVEEIIDEGEDE